MEKIDHIAKEYSQLQQEICKMLELSDGSGKFTSDKWKKNVGFGTTRVLQNGTVIEKGAVNFSHVKGAYSHKMEAILGEKAQNFAATGISSILHPHNPFVPIIHMNVRYFALDNGISWFGGGIDLTPHIINIDEARWFHQTLKKTCDKFDSGFYSEFKEWADNYFFLHHRNETRGVGGIFFDRIKPNNSNTFEKLFDFTFELAKLYPKIYSELMKNNHSKKYSEKEKQWQNLRRGRYAEFNLIHDRGTRFGLESGGNTESILVSLPPNATWMYNFDSTGQQVENETQKFLKKGIDWINFYNK
jgi:coproporphyrinogen III oxidase